MKRGNPFNPPPRRPSQQPRSKRAIFPSHGIPQNKIMHHRRGLPEVPKQPRRDVRTDVHVAFQLFNVNLDEEWDVLNIPLSRIDFDNWFKQEQIALYDLERYNTQVEKWLTEFLKDPFKNREQFKIPELDMMPEKVSPQAEKLLPLNIEIQHEGKKYCDKVLWNPKNDVDLKQFAQSIVEDEKFPNSCIRKIMDQIQDQIDVFNRDPKPSADDIRDDLIRGYVEIEFKSSYRGIRVADKFLWNVYDEFVSPEEFARQYVLDVGLSSEWASKIAHCIRTRCHQHRTSIARKQLSGLKYSTTHNRSFVRSCEELDTEKWQPTVLVLRKS